MGITTEQCRCRIGTFTQPVKCKVAVPALKLKYILLSIRVMLFFMHLSRGIEANPGPPPTNSANSAPLPTSSVTYSRGGGRVRGTGLVEVEAMEIITRHIRSLRQQPELSGAHLRIFTDNPRKCLV